MSKVLVARVRRFDGRAARGEALSSDVERAVSLVSIWPSVGDGEVRDPCRDRDAATVETGCDIDVMVESFVLLEAWAPSFDPHGRRARGARCSFDV